MIAAGNTLEAAEAGAVATIGAFVTDHGGNLLALTTRAFAAADENFCSPDDLTVSISWRPSGYYADITERPDAAENLIGWLIVSRTCTLHSAVTGSAVAITSELLLEDVWMIDAAGTHCAGYVSGLDSSARFTLGDTAEPHVYRGLIRVAASTPRPRFAAAGSAGALLHDGEGNLLGIFVGEADGQGLFAPLASTLAAEGLELATSDALAAHNRRVVEASPHHWSEERPPAIERMAHTLPRETTSRMSPAAILFEWVSTGIAQQQEGIEEAFGPYAGYFDNDPVDRDALVMRLSEFCYFELPQGPDAAHWEQIVMDAYAAMVHRQEAEPPQHDLRGSHGRVLKKAA